jgi:hypothetical protein
MEEERMTDPLVSLARRAEREPFLLASALADYARSEELDHAALAARLGCTVEQLTLVRLCRTPRSDPADFRADVEVIAGHYHLDEGVLVEAVKRSRVMRRTQGASATEAGLLMAARDREQPPRPDAEAP